MYEIDAEKYAAELIAWVKCKQEFCKCCWDASCDIGKPDLDWAAKILFGEQTIELIKEMVKDKHIMTIDEAYMQSAETLIMYEIYRA